MAIDAAYEGLWRVSKRQCQRRVLPDGYCRLGAERWAELPALSKPMKTSLGVDSRTSRAPKDCGKRGRRRAMDEGATLLDPDTFIFRTIRFWALMDRGSTSCSARVSRWGIMLRFGRFATSKGPRYRRRADWTYARLRPGTKIGEDVHIGNFVELKNTTMAPAKANHLAMSVIPKLVRRQISAPVPHAITTGSKA